ncbi:MAG: MBL fold metallo-hydrolase [Alphaproteobacteria bacterium]|nr:MBL fold metallo-hydrolase [Alphaproteobacteria bacterium]
MRKGLLTTIAAAALLTIPLGAQAQMDDVKIKAQKLTDGIHMLRGKGGNIGVLTGPDGTFMIDDQFAPLTDKILAAIKEIGGDVPRFMINTHYHHDHTGGNENLGNKGVIIVSHDNVRKKLVNGATIKAFNKVIPPAAKAAVPVITFAEEMTFHLNGETLHVFHSSNAHTDGDSIIHFKKANVIHAGDTFFNGFYPFIDTGAGGTVQGVIAAVDKMLALADDNTKIIPGHGPLADKAALVAYRTMLMTAQTRLSSLKSSGKSAADAVAAKPLSDLETTWGKGFLPTDKWITIVYDGV